MMKFLNKKQFKHGSLATIITVFFVVALVLINIIATMIFNRFPITFDLTENSAFTVSDKTIDYVKKIDKNVTISILAAETDFANISTYLNQANELIKSYSQHNSKITVKYYDLLKNPDVVSAYKQTLYTGDIIVEVDDGSDTKRVKVLNAVDLVNFDESFAQSIQQQYGADISTLSAGGNALGVIQNFSDAIVSSKAEQSITSALMAVTDSNPIKVTVITGRGEEDVSGFTNLLDKNGYLIDSINIEKEEIPADTSVILIAAPTVDYSSSELEKIDKYLYNDGKLEKDLIYFASVEQPLTPNIDEFLAEWGVKIGRSEILETNKKFYQTSEQFPFQNMVNDAYRQDIANSGLSILLPNVRPVTPLWEDEGYYTTQRFLSSSSSAVLKPFGSSEKWTDSDATEKGVFDSFVVGSRLMFTDDNKPLYNNVAVVGSVNLINPAFITSAQLNNGDFILSFMNGMTQKAEGVVILPKSLNGATFDITAKQINALKWAFVFFIPACIIVVGFVVVLRRKNR